MKKPIFFVCLFLFVEMAFANDTRTYLVGGTLHSTTNVPTNVEMRDETINITLNDDFFEVVVDFNFYNSGKAETLMVAFPYFDFATEHSVDKIYDFQCWTNGKITDFSSMPIEVESTSGNYKKEIKNAYARSVVFPSKTFTKTKISYKSTYGYAVRTHLATYLYGTGSSWKGNIGKMHLVVVNNIKYRYIRNVEMGNQNYIKLKRTKDNVFEADFYDVNPENYTDFFEIQMYRMLDFFDSTGKEVFTTTPYTHDNLWNYTKEQLKLLRNGVYAAHGYIFKSPDLTKFFSENIWWYEPNKNFSESEFNEIERATIKAISEEEKLIQ